MSDQEDKQDLVVVTVSKSLLEMASQAMLVLSRDYQLRHDFHHATLLEKGSELMDSALESAQPPPDQNQHMDLCSECIVIGLTNDDVEANLWCAGCGAGL